MSVINLDYLSANPIAPTVQEAMIEVIRHNQGNPSSSHHLGDKALDTLEKARASAARLINAADPKEVVFTSSGTESINMAVKGVAWAKVDQGKHIVTSNIEHNAVLRTLRRLRLWDYQVTSVPVDPMGRVNPDDVAAAIRDDTVLVSVMHANNEIGTLQPIKEIGEITKKKKILFHCDAVVSVGAVPVDVQDLKVDLLSFAANQFYGPSGVGGLYIRRGAGLWRGQWQGVRRRAEALRSGSWRTFSGARAEPSGPGGATYPRLGRGRRLRCGRCGVDYPLAGREIQWSSSVGPPPLTRGAWQRRPPRRGGLRRPDRAGGRRACYRITASLETNVRPSLASLTK